MSIKEVKAMLDTTEKGGVRNSIKNCLTVFQHDPLLSGAIAYNLLTDRTDIVKPIGYDRSPMISDHTPVFIGHMRPDRKQTMYTLPIMSQKRCHDIFTT